MTAAQTTRRGGAIAPLLALLVVCICGTSILAEPTEAAPDLGDDLVVRQLSSGVWLFVSFKPGNKAQRMASNGLLVTTGEIWRTTMSSPKSGALSAGSAIVEVAQMQTASRTRRGASAPLRLVVSAAIICGPSSTRGPSTRVTATRRRRRSPNRRDPGRRLQKGI
jgi:hypothetical protein